MKLRPLVAGSIALLAVAALAVFASITNNSYRAAAGPSTPTATPCPTDTGPDPVHGGCIPSTPTPTATPCPPDWEPGPTPGYCVHGTPPNATWTATPCPTGKVPDTFGGSGCGTPTATPTSQRPWGAQVTLVDHYPSPAVSGQKKTWAFEIENIGSQYGCEPHEVAFSAELTGQSYATFYRSTTLACHETAEVTVSSIVTVPLGQTVSITAHAQAGAQSGNTIEVSDNVVNPPPPTPARTLGDFNCDGTVNAIDATLVLQVSAGLAVPLPCTGDGDVNHDGMLNSIDAFLMLQYHAGLIAEFP